MYLYGAGGYFRVVADVLNGDSQKYCELNSENINDFTELDQPLIICIRNNLQRAKIVQKLKATYGNAIHSSSIVCKNVIIGEGTVILHGAIIQSRSKIGKHVLINAASSVGHDNIVNDYVHVWPGATLCGHVVVGEGSSIGAGAVVIPTIKIGKWCVIEAGAVVINDVPDYSMVGGCPAKILINKSVKLSKLCAEF